MLHHYQTMHPILSRSLFDPPTTIVFQLLPTVYCRQPDTDGGAATATTLCSTRQQPHTVWVEISSKITIHLLEQAKRIGKKKEQNKRVSFYAGERAHYPKKLISHIAMIPPAKLERGKTQVVQIGSKREERCGVWFFPLMVGRLGEERDQRWL